MVNLLIIYKATTYSRLHRTSIGVSTGSNFRSEVRKAQMTKMILFITFLYITLSMPNVIIAGYFFSYISSFYSGQMIINILNSIQFAYPSFHFFILYISNKQFANQVKAIVLRLRSSHMDSSFGKTKSNHSAQQNTAHSHHAHFAKNLETSHRATDGDLEIHHH